MTDWTLPPDLQQKYNEIVAHQRRLQAEFGIKPRTLEERHQDYLKRKAEEAQQQEEITRLKQLTGQKRPPPKWKV